MTDLRFALHLLLCEERLRPEAGWHPSTEELTAYYDRRLSPRRAARVCRHLGFCFDCPDLLLELERFVAFPRGEVDAEADAETAAAWQTLRRRLFEIPA